MIAQQSLLDEDIDVFGSAEETTTTKPKDTKLEVVISETKHTGFSKKLKRREELDNLIKASTAEKEALDDVIKEVGFDSLIDLYEQTKVRPSSFEIKGEHGGCALFIAMDKYAAIDKARAAELSARFGKDIVTEEKEFKFDKVLLAKHMKLIQAAFNGTFSMKLSDLRALVDLHRNVEDDEATDTTVIVKAAGIPKEDLSKLLKAPTKYAVTKGAISRFMQFDSPATRSEFLFNIAPQLQLKGRE